jgi:negative regulator of flagellin synthesis FlgM
MKIGALEPKASGHAPVADRKPAAPAANTGAEPSAKVELSSAAQLANTDSSDPASFDGAKVERIAQAIRDGKFRINPEAIAEKLIANAQELLSRKAS